MKQKYRSFSMKTGLCLSVVAAIFVSASSPFSNLNTVDPPSDSFALAPTIDPLITNGATFTSTVVDTTTFSGGEDQDKPLDGCGRNAGNHSAWYKYVAPASPALQSITIDTLNSETELDTMLGIYLYDTGTGALTEIACDDDSPNSDVPPPASTNKSRTNAALIGGQTYYIVGSSFNGAIGTPIPCPDCDPGGNLVLTITYNHSLAGSPPSVLSAVRTNPDNTTSSVVNYTVTFSESVTGVDLFDFSVTTDGVTNAKVISVTGSGTTYNVSIDTGFGKGTLTLHVRKNGTIINSNIYPLGAGFVGETYTIVRNVIYLPLIER